MSDSMQKQLVIDRLRERLAQAEDDRDTAEARAAQAEWDRDTLAAELRAWHDACYPSSAVDARREHILIQRISITQSTGALQRAKEAK